MIKVGDTVHNDLKGKDKQFNTGEIIKVAYGKNKNGDNYILLIGVKLDNGKLEQYPPLVFDKVFKEKIYEYTNTTKNNNSKQIKNRRAK